MVDSEDDGEREATRTESLGRTTLSTPSDEAGGGQMSVLIISDRQVTTRPLPASGEVTIGRATSCDLVIDDPSISRSHAALTIGPPLMLRDLGSANGTRLRDRQLGAGESVMLHAGEVVQLGNATLIVQRRAPQVRAQRLWAHDYFEVRVEEQCARASRDGGSFAVARLRCEPPPSLEQLHLALGAAGRSGDVVGEYGPGEYELLMVDAGPEAADQALEALAVELRRGGVVVSGGVACFPRDGRSPDELIHRAAPFSRAKEPAADAAVSAAIVADRRMQDLYSLAERIAAGNITVLILGETGVGKEVLAERVHRLSPRSARPYLKLNCAALSETLLESELFGHERGAFTGAVAAKQGLLETADGGTIFLDEIGELPHSIQVKLLRVIEERMVLRVGGLKARPLDVRFIAATNRDLENEITRGTFRQDLFFRLNGATLVIPPLRERVSEIPDLARAFIGQAARQMGMAAQPALSREALEVLCAYSWPGNIRELRNVVERAVLLCTGGAILPAHLPLEKMRVTLGMRPTPSALMPASVRQTLPPGTMMPSLGSPGPTMPPPSFGAAAHQPPPPRPPAPLPPPPSAAAPPLHGQAADPTVQLVVPLEGSGAHGGGAESEKDRILRALNECAGNQTAAAARLGIARRTLINKLELYGISRPRKGR
jgi:two-component system, NtrC family, response regulator AtoC